MDTAYNSKESELFTKGSHHRNISLVVITQNLLHHGPSFRDISVNNKYTVLFKNLRDKTQIVYLALHVYPENTSRFHKMYLEDFKDSHTYLFLGLTQSINDLLRFRTKISWGNVRGFCTCSG